MKFVFICVTMLGHVMQVKEFLHKLVKSNETKKG